MADLPHFHRQRQTEASGMTSKLTLLFMVPKISLLPPNHNPYPQSLVYEAFFYGVCGIHLFSFLPTLHMGCPTATGKGFEGGCFPQLQLSGGGDNREWDEQMGWGQWNRLGEDGMDRRTGCCR